MKKNDNTLEGEIREISREIDEIHKISRVPPSNEVERCKRAIKALYLNPGDELHRWAKGPSPIQIAWETGKPIKGIKQRLREKLKKITREMGV